VCRGLKRVPPARKRSCRGYTTLAACLDWVSAGAFLIDRGGPYRVAMQSNVLHEEVVSQAQAALFREQKRHQAQGRSLARLEGAF
jgi:hypothetical protein